MDSSSDPFPDTSKDLKTMLTKPRRMWRLSAIEEKLRTFSPGERLVLYILTALLALSTLGLLAAASASISVTVPSAGGSFTEGEVGPARFINPILTLSQPDEDLTQLVYSGLVRALPDGSIAPDLASSYQISPDGTTYTFTLRQGATFHDGTALTASDILFTVQKAQDPEIKSPRRADWEGVVASSPDPYTVVFKLPHPYAPFIENATLGILPKHLWQNISAEEFPFTPLNTHPVGSGPYRVTGQSTDSTGAPVRYELAPFQKSALGPAFIKRIVFLFYPDERALVAAYNAGKIDSFAGVSPSQLGSLERAGTMIVRAPLPRTFGVFFNQSKNAVLADASVRAALNAAVDKDTIVDSVLGGYGVPLEGPIPPGILGAARAATPVALPRTAASSTPASGNAEKARAILAAGGWTWNASTNTWTKKKQTLQFSLATADESELAATAQAVSAQWRAAGIGVDVHVYPLSELNTNIIRPRAYEAVLFGEVVGRTADLFAFWHSSQRNDPGLNLALYANSKVDALLSSARATTDEKNREKLYAQFATAIEKDQPAVFLYAPEFIYVVRGRLQGIEIGSLTSAAERFLNVYQWYTDTERVWSIFTNRTN